MRPKSDEGLTAVIPERPSVLSGAGTMGTGVGTVAAEARPPGLGEVAPQMPDLWSEIQREMVPGAAAFQRDQAMAGPSVPMAAPEIPRPSVLAPQMGGMIPGAVAGAGGPMPGPMPRPGGRKPDPLPGGSGQDAISAGMSTAAQFASPSLAAEQDSQNAAEQDMRTAAAARAKDDETNKWLALAIGGAKMATTPGGLFQGAAAGLGAGIEAYKSWQQEDLMNRLKQEAADLDRQQLGETGRHNLAAEEQAAADLRARTADAAMGRAGEEARRGLEERRLNEAGYVQMVDSTGKTVWHNPVSGDTREAPEGLTAVASRSSAFDLDERLTLERTKEAHALAMEAATTKDPIKGDKFDLAKYFEVYGQLTGSVPATAPVAPTGSVAPDAALSEARAAIAKDADPAQVKARLQQMGIDPSGL